MGHCWISSVVFTLNKKIQNFIIKEKLNIYYSNTNWLLTVYVKPSQGQGTLVVFSKDCLWFWTLLEIHFTLMNVGLSCRTRLKKGREKDPGLISSKSTYSTRTATRINKKLETAFDGVKNLWLTLRYSAYKALLNIHVDSNQ